MRVSDFGRKILNLFYPERCPYCRKVIAFGEPYCKECECTFPPISSIRHIGEFEGKDILCLSILKYDGMTAQAVWRFKFRGKSHYAKSFAIVMANGIISNEYFNKKFDVITEVPLSKIRKRMRGYNQSELLAKEIGKILQIKHENLLSKNRENMEQHTLSAKDRRLNVIGVYSPINLDMIKNKNILICDDVVTTGSTLFECVKILYMSGAKNVCCVTLTNASYHIDII